MADPLKFYPNRSRLALYAAVMLLLLSVSVLVMLNLELVMHKYLRLGCLIFGFLGVTLFGYGLVYNLVRLSQPRPILRADADGLHFNASLLNHGTVLWPNIREYGVVKYAGQKLILVYLKEPFEFLARRKGTAARHLRAKLKRYGTPVAIPAALIPGDPVKVLEALSNYRG